MNACESVKKAATQSEPDSLSDNSAAEASSNAPPEPDSHKVQLMGRADCDRIVVFDGNPRLAGTMVEVDIHDCTPTTLLGNIVTRQTIAGLDIPLPVVS
ncbi:TRAM domain-containing protein [bacterium]|nr:TRAM domain-containing protein [bacterium]